MPRQIAYAVENNFNKGLLTEFTGLNFPEAACTDALNSVFQTNGSVIRRLGFDAENNYQYRSLPTAYSSTLAYKSYYWSNVANSGERVFVVVQLGSIIKFFFPGADGNISQNIHSTSIDLSTYAVAGSPDTGTQEVFITEGNGALFLAHPYIDPLYITYSTSLDTFSITQISIQIRDTKGVDDGTIVDTRGSTIDSKHKYNLFNQGWNTPAKTAGFGDTPYISWIHYRDDFPSNADVWWINKDPNEQFNINWIDRVSRGNTPASRGHFILPAFNQDRSLVSGISGLDKESSGYYRPNSIAFFAGRAWYAGVNAINFSNNVYYSQIIKDTTDYAKCYQQEDLTSEDKSDLLSSDGGVVKIPEAARIVYLLPLNQNLYVFATNGTWVISGSQGVGFVATDYSVSKLSDIGAISASSFINAIGTPLWWNSDGIYTLQSNNLGNSSIISLTEQTNKSYFENIPLASKVLAKGAFSLTNKECIWLYQDVDSSTYNFITIRLVNNAFSPYTISNTRQIVSMFAIEGFANNIIHENIVDSSGVLVTDAGGTTFVNVSSPTTLVSTFKCVIINASNNTYTIAGFSDTTLQDWTSVSAEDYDSFVISGYKIRGQAIKKFGMPFIQTFFDLRQYPTGSCLLTGVWDYANDGNSGRFTNPQEVYPTTDNFDFSFTRRRIRGNGTSLQLKFQSVANNPYHIIGWSEVASGDQTV